MHEERKVIIEGASCAVLFIHGIVGSPRHFESFYPLIPKNVSYYAILLEGHGSSVKAFGKAKMVSWKKQASEAVNFLLETHERLIIVAHSMGTLFAIDESIKHKDKITHLFLLNSPLKAYLHPVMLKYSLQFLVKSPNGQDPKSLAAMNSISASPDLHVWRYLSWIPRFLELFSEIRKTRKKLINVSVSNVFYHSYHDELVMRSSVKYIKKYKNLNLKILKDSSHFYYVEKDVDIMVSDFTKIFE